MKLETLLRWRVNDLLSLRALPEDSEAAKAQWKALCGNATPVCAAEIKGAAPGSSLYPLSRRRKFWAGLGYGVIALFLATVAAFVLSYLMRADGRYPWLTGGVLGVEAALAAVEILLMLLSANRVTALQDAHTRAVAEEVWKAWGDLPPKDADAMARTLRQDARPDEAGQRCACLACGQVFRFSDHPGADPMDEECPLCQEHQLVFEASEVPLDDDLVNRLQSFLSDGNRED